MKILGLLVYSNKAILSLKPLRGWLVFVLLLVNVLMVSAPLIRARSIVTGADILDRFDGAQSALLTAFADNDCVIQGRLFCQTPSVRQIGSFEVGFLQAPTSESYIFFDANQMIIQTPESFFFGSYEFAQGVRLQEINSSAMLEELMYGFATSGAGFDFSLIVLGQLIQIVLLVLTLSFMLQISNYRSKVQRIRFRSALQLSLVAMIGPALLGGFIGFIEPSIAGIVFFAAYSLRMMYLYFGLFKNPEIQV